MGLKKKYPFRLGTTSFILAADMVTNVRYLADKVDDIELLVFESDEMAELPDAGTIAELESIARQHDLTYTVHLPLDIWLGDSSEKERERSVKKCFRTIDKMNMLDPFAWVLHCNREGRHNSRIEHNGDWAAAVEVSVTSILTCGVSARSICIETLDGSFPLLEPMIKNHGLSICLDVGHLILYQLPFEEYLQKYVDQARVIHLHGVKDGKDHKDISGINHGYLEMLRGAMQSSGNKDRVVTLEVFNEADFAVSQSILERFVQ